MINFRNAIVSGEADLKTVIQAIDKGSLQIALVVGIDGKLEGTVTDGDIRRALIRGVTLEQSVQLVMNKNPFTKTPGHSRLELLNLMNSRGLKHIPIVDESFRPVGLEMLQEPTELSGERENHVVIMAGGMGKRLGTLTTHTPKPMLNVKSRPILETIVMQLAEFGFRHIHLSVNYKREMIVNHFGDGSRFGVNVKYISEEFPMGTAGSLSLLPDRPKHPLLVMNADLVTTVNFGSLLEFHEQNGALASVCVREYENQVPFGVVNIDDDHTVLSVEEKPKFRFFVNAGIYVLEPVALDFIPKGQRFDMPELLDAIRSGKQKVKAFPIRENWVDVGLPEDFERANRE